MFIIIISFFHIACFLFETSEAHEKQNLQNKNGKGKRGWLLTFVVLYLDKYLVCSGTNIKVSNFKLEKIEILSRRVNCKKENKNSKVPKFRRLQ